MAKVEKSTVEATGKKIDPFPRTALRIVGFGLGIWGLFALLPTVGKIFLGIGETIRHGLTSGVRIKNRSAGMVSQR